MAPLEAHLPARKPPAAFNACVEESSVLQTVTRHIGGKDSTLNKIPQSIPADDHPQSAGDDVVLAASRNMCLIWQFQLL